MLVQFRRTAYVSPRDLMTLRRRTEGGKEATDDGIARLTRPVDICVVRGSDSWVSQRGGIENTGGKQELFGPE